jgi:hypothetical protein
MAALGFALFALAVLVACALNVVSAAEDNPGSTPLTHYFTQRQDHYDRQNLNMW